MKVPSLDGRNKVHQFLIYCFASVWLRVVADKVKGGGVIMKFDFNCNGVCSPKRGEDRLQVCMRNFADN